MLKQIVFMIIASLSFAVMGFLVRFADGTHLLWKVFFRNLIVMLVIFLSMPISSWKSLTGAPGNRKLLFLRGFSGSLGVLGYFIGLTYLPLANASILNRLNPFFVALLAAVLLKQKLKLHHVLSLLLAFTGAVLVVNPGADYPILPTLAVLSSAFTAGLAYTVIRIIGDREDPRTIMSYFAVVSLVLILPLLIIIKPHISLPDILPLVGVGFFAAIGQGLLTIAYRGGHAATISAYGYSNVIFAAILGYLFFGESPHPLEYAGAALIFISLLILYVWGERIANRKRN